MAKNLSQDVQTSTAAKPKKPRTPRVKKEVTQVMEHAVVADTTMTAAAPGGAPEVDELQSLLAELGVVEDGALPTTAASNDEIVIELAAPSVAEPAAVHAEPDMQTLEELSARAEATELVIAAATPDTVDDGSAPTGDSSDAVAAAPAEDAAPKKERVPRKHYSDKVERLKDRMGASLGDYMVLTTADALVDDEAALKVTMDATLQIIRDMNSKEKNRASGFIEFLSGKKAKLNNVLERVLGVLERDGFLQTGNDGNVFKNLLERPYSPASARAMGGNTVSMFADLKVILAEGKGRFVANPDSLLLAKAKSMLASAVGGTSEEPSEDSSAEAGEGATTVVEEALV